MKLTAAQLTIKRANTWKLLSLLALLLFTFVILVTIENLLVSSLVAFVISYTLAPFVSTLERQGWPRGRATVVVFLAVGVLLVGFGFWLFPYLGRTLSGLQGDMPHYIQGLGQFITELESRIRSIAGPLANFDVTGKVEAQLTQWTQDFFDRLPTFLKSFFTVMLLGPFLAYFMVKDGRAVVNVVLGLVPNPVFEAALSLVHQINMQIGQFVRARILESLIVGLVTAIGLLVIGFPYAVLLGVIAGLTNFIPYLGPLMGAVPAFLIALVNGQTGLAIVLVALVYVVAQLIDAGLLIPVLVAKIVDLHPVTVIVVIIAGAQLLGVLGMIISIPVASTLKVTFTTLYKHLTDTGS